MNKVLNEQPDDPIVYIIKCLYRKASLPVPKVRCFLMAGTDVTSSKFIIAFPNFSSFPFFSYQPQLRLMEQGAISS